MKKGLSVICSTLMVVFFQNCSDYNPMAAKTNLSSSNDIEKTHEDKFDLAQENQPNKKSTPASDNLILPIELIPRTINQMVNGFYKSERVCLAKRIQTQRLQLTFSVHRPGYRRLRTAGKLWENFAKLSLIISRSNERPPAHHWIDIRNDNPRVTQMPSTIRAGGLSGSEKSAKIAVSFLSSRVQSNSCFWLHLRFNGTEGISSGMSIFDIEAREIGGTEVVVYKTKTHPSRRQVITTGNINLGRQLFRRRNILIEDPLSRRQIKSSCVDCHAEGGRDIHFYGFSDQSIITRGLFHGLNLNQANSIKEYIRDFNQSRNLRIVGRPWNPPFQPGYKHLQANNLSDQQLADRWNAGAGIGAVSSSDASRGILDTVFGVDDVSQLNRRHIQNLFEGKRLNVPFKNGTPDFNAIPTHMQFPDWNEWLPLASPHDLFAAANGENLFLKTRLFRHYLYLRSNLTELKNNPRQLLEQLTEFHRRASRLFGVWRDHLSVNPNHPRGCTGGVGLQNPQNAQSCGLKINSDRELNLMARAFANGYSREMTRRSTVAWANVKLWELIRTHRLETFAHQRLSRNWNQVSWPSNYMSAFAYAPHIVANNISHFEHSPTQQNGRDRNSIIGQNETQGKFESNQWYQVQLALNTGNFQAIDHRPNDWPYTYSHVASSTRLSDSTEDALTGKTTANLSQSLRFVIIFAIANHMRQKTRTDLLGYTMRYMSPMWTVAGHWRARVFNNGRVQLRDEHLKNLNRLKPGLHSEFVTAYLTHFLNQAEELSRKNLWLRCNSSRVRSMGGPTHWFCLPRYDRNLHKRNLQANTKFLFDTIEWDNKMDHLQLHLNTQHFVKKMGINKTLLNRYDRWLVNNFPGLPPDRQ